MYREIKKNLTTANVSRLVTHASDLHLLGEERPASTNEYSQLLEGRISTNLLARYKAVQIATLVDSVPSGENSVHEMRYGGYRTMVAVGGGEACAYTRSLSGWRRSRSRH